MSFKNYNVEVFSFLNFILVFNPGISFGFLGDGGETQRILLTMFASVVALALTFWAIISDKASIKISLAMIAGGAVGNAIDRVLYGAVVDFIDFHYLDWHWPTFNIADSFILVGVILFLYNELFLIKGKKNEF